MSRKFGRAVPCALINDQGRVESVIMARPDVDPAPKGYLMIDVPHENYAALVDSRWEYAAEKGIEPNAELKAERAQEARKIEEEKRNPPVGDAEAVRG